MLESGMAKKLNINRGSVGREPVIKKPVVTRKEKPLEKQIEETKKVVPIQRKPVPSGFKVSSLLVSIKKTTSLENDIARKSKALDNLKIDASSYDAVKHIKDRSSVGNFYRQFEESKVILDDYIYTLRKSEKDKRGLMTLLTGGEAFYEVAQDEAKVIVNAYKTFGNRLHSMKKKLDSRLKKMEQELPSRVTKERPRRESSSSQQTNIQDMDLDSDSGDEVPTSQQYNPNTAPSHEHTDDTTQNDSLDEQIEQNDTLDSKQLFNSQQTFNMESINGMTSFLDLSSNSMALQTNADQPTPLSETSVTTPDGLVIADDPVNNVFPLVTSTSSTITHTEQMAIPAQHQVTPAQHQGRPLQSLIDSLFPVLSKSLQTIKEKQQAVDEENQPSVNDAIAFALGDGKKPEEGVPRKKSRFSSDQSQAISPVSLTNPKGLSDNQTELISIACGLTKFDENFLPVIDQTNTQNNEQQNQQATPQLEGEEETTNVTEEHERRNDRKGRHSSSRHRSSHRDDDRYSRRSSSRSPSRRSSHRSSRDSREDRREERHSERRRSRRSPSPRRKKGSRGRRSSSRDDAKRRHSPDQKKAPYYNDRRSPTPELDSSSHPPSHGGPFPPPVSQVMSSNNQITNQTYPTVESNNSSSNNEAQKVQENTGIESEGNRKGIDQTTDIPSSIQEPSVNMMHLGNSIQPPLQLNGLPFNLNTNGTFRPFINPFQNPLQLLQQQVDNQPKILHLRPIGPPGILPFNQPPNQIIDHQAQNLPSMNQTLTRISNSAKLNDTTETMESGLSNGNNPLRILSQQLNTEDKQNKLHEPFSQNIQPFNGLPEQNIQPFNGPPDPSIQSFKGPPPEFPGPPPKFPGPPPVPPQNFGPMGVPMMNDNFSPRPRMFRPKFAEPDPLLDQLEMRNMPNSFERPNFAAPDPLLDQLEMQNMPNSFETPNFELQNGPRFRPRFDIPHGVRFRPRFEGSQIQESFYEKF